MYMYVSKLKEGFTSLKLATHMRYMYTAYACSVWWFVAVLKASAHHEMTVFCSVSFPWLTCCFFGCPSPFTLRCVPSFLWFYTFMYMLSYGGTHVCECSCFVVMVWFWVSNTYHRAIIHKRFENLLNSKCNSWRSWLIVPYCSYQLLYAHPIPPV